MWWGGGGSNESSEKNEGGGGGFWDFVSKTAETYKRDLSEFVSVVETDTKKTLEEIASEGKGGTGGITKIFSGEDGTETKARPTESQEERKVYGRLKRRVVALQDDVATFRNEPTPADAFAEWRSGFEVDARTDDIAAALAENSVLREHHAKIVPVELSYNVFWERYFFAMHKLEQEEERRAAVVMRAQDASASDEEIGWGAWDDDDDDDDVDGLLESDPPAASPAGGDGPVPEADDGNGGEVGKATGKEQVAKEGSPQGASGTEEGAEAPVDVPVVGDATDIVDRDGETSAGTEAEEDPLAEITNKLLDFDGAVAPGTPSITTTTQEAGTPLTPWPDDAASPQQPSDSPKVDVVGDPDESDDGWTAWE